MNTQEKLLQIENIYVCYPRVKAILDEIETCRVDSKLSREPRSMLLLGESGAGKSTTIDQYLTRFPARNTDERLVIPVFKSAIPSKVTCKSVAQSLLTEMGAPRPESGNQVSLTTRLARLLVECETELIILDEFQHLLQRGAEKTLDEVSDWIKTLINKTQIPILLVGTPNSESILRTNTQLDRRFCVVEELKCFSWLDDSKEYRLFLKHVDKALPFDTPANLADPDRAIRIFAASEGKPAFTMMLIREASKTAIKRGLSALTDELLSEAFNKYLLRKTRLKRNPWPMSYHDLEAFIDKLGPTDSPSYLTGVKSAISGSALSGTRP